MVCGRRGRVLAGIAFVLNQGALPGASGDELVQPTAPQAPACERRIAHLGVGAEPEGGSQWMRTRNGWRLCRGLPLTVERVGEERMRADDLVGIGSASEHWPWPGVRAAFHERGARTCEGEGLSESAL
ncbi:hypothetical protein GCM10018980_19650 [Streptomyces capoamus]|uniref:Uncharacterized protein n=1 Tax=Streptomyces capoamus TaxID=68183 RepID=A0A919C4M5_9ACTN|nr:hypothetical protein GCM10010501_33240 [Streptomyces libani subsp. rufus]GHG43060.1 hypothetical protein GCM10018980_19650 [Streptomyces capoamus]